MFAYLRGVQQKTTTPPTTVEKRQQPQEEKNLYLSNLLIEYNIVHI